MTLAFILQYRFESRLKNLLMLKDQIEPWNFPRKNELEERYYVIT